MAISTKVQEDPMAREFLKYIEEATKEETLKIIKKYQEQMNKDLEAVREKIVAQAGIRLSSMMSVEHYGQTIRIEITKRKEQ